ncbi:YhdP family protein [Uliginosibacterium sp. H3]|uniref:YhdP family protein n=1 Tax=Uliginosibacterium silvisoli TaxID=3114758 RepID=A0ABU6K2M6_9RHOO|nr:YhdP family protein [Uliginosibacterium sp. H3]
MSREAPDHPTPAEHSAPPAGDTPDVSAVSPARRRHPLLTTCLHIGRFSLRLPHIAWAVVWRCVLVTWLVLAAAFLLVRYVAMPQVAEHRVEIASALSQALGLKVEIDALQAQWNGLRPELQMRGMRIFDKEQRVALALPRVDAVVAWSSLLRWQLELQRLRLDRPELALRREADGTVFVAGIAVRLDKKQDDSKLGELLLSQHEIHIDNARVLWEDQVRKAPPLVFDKLSLLLQNRGDTHRFSVAATPAGNLSGPIDLRGDLRGDWTQKAPQTLADWRGTIYLALERTDLAVWRQWVDYPITVPHGRGALRTWLNFEGARIGGLTADLALSDVQVRFAPDLPMLSLRTASGRVRLAARENDFSFAAERLALTTTDGLQIAPTKFSMRRVGPASGEALKDRTRRKPGGEISAEKLDMRVLAQLAAYLPFPQAARKTLADADPQGEVSLLQASWEDADAASSSTLPFAHFDIDASFDKLTLKPGDGHPGFARLSGRVTGSDRKGEFRFEVRNGALDLPGIMHESHIPLDALDANGNWGRDNAGALTVNVGKLRVVNRDMQSAEFSADWRAAPGPEGSIDMTGRVQGFKAPSAWRYIPSVVPIETSEWLKRGLTTGTGENVRVRLSGDLAKFPFRNDPKGIFRVEGGFAGINLDFADGWPVLNNLTGELLFDRTRMLIKSHSGNYRQAKLGEVQAQLADLTNVRQQPLVINGRAAGSGADLLHYLQASPVAEHLGSFIQGMRQEGEGSLDLKLSVPLMEAEHTRVQGSYRFENSKLSLIPELPPFTQVRGAVGFTENGIAPTQVIAEFLGGQVNASGRTAADGTILFDASGQIPVTGLHQLIDTPVWNRLAGITPVTARIAITKERADVTVDSSLLGVSSSLPAPFAKSADTRLPFVFNWSLSDEPGVANSSLQDWRISLDTRGSAQWQDRCGKDTCSFLRGAVALNDGISLPTRGLRVSGRFQTLDADQWLPVIQEAMEGQKSTAKRDATILSGGVLQANEVLVRGHRFTRVIARVVQQGERWVLRLEGPDIAGDINWTGQTASGQAARLGARLSVLKLHPLPAKPLPPGTPTVSSRDSDEKLPTLDITAEQFELRDMKLGKLSLHSEDQAGHWHLSELRIESPDAVITGEGDSRALAGGGKQTEVKLDVTSENVGGFLGRLGYADAVLRGKATLKGQLVWNAAVSSFDYSSLNGELRMNVTDGQFNKLEPGAARLLGILSLQSLPRRITLDFRDVFSEGFAFDSIRGDIHIEQGVMKTDDLQVRGPAARVYIKGSTDIARETHALRLTVQPTLSEGIALGVTMVNPVFGVATYLAQKVLQDPFEKIFSFEYAVTGSWNDPKIEKEGVTTTTVPSVPLSGKK